MFVWLLEQAGGPVVVTFVTAPPWERHA